MKQQKPLSKNLKHHLLTLSIVLVTNFTLSAQNEFITKWETTTVNESITIPTTGSGYNYMVDWGDGTTTNHTGDATHTYATAGTQTVKITGTFPRIYFNNAGDKGKIVDITQWGTIQWTSMDGAFSGCSNLQVTATDTPDLSSVSSMRRMFKSASTVTFTAGSGTTNWDTSSITNMYEMFTQASSANPDVSKWDTSNVTQMGFMFSEAKAANPDVSAWDTSKVINMGYMFDRATAANPNVTNWNTASVTDMQSLFKDTTLANPNVTNWITASVFNMASMFFGAKAADPDVSMWNIANVSNMYSMFRDTSLAKPNVSSWNVSNVTRADFMFSGATVANPDLSRWIISNINNLGRFLDNSGISEANYDAALINFAGQTVKKSVSMSASGVTYCSQAAQDARASLIADDGWTIINDKLCTTASITEVLFNESAFNVYPNPLSGSSLSYSYPKAIEDLTVEVYTLLGQKTKSVKATTNGSGKSSLDLDLSSGIYIVKFGNSKDQNNVVKKLIIR